MKFGRDDIAGEVFATVQRWNEEFAAVQQVGANVVMRTVHPENRGLWFESNSDLDALLRFGQAIIDAATAAKERRTT